MLLRHKKSCMHKEAEESEAIRLASKKDGGIRQLMSAFAKKGLDWSSSDDNWLAKEELPHTTKFSSLKDLAVQLGCNYMCELCIGKNAQYSCEQIIAEFLQCLAQVIVDKIIADIQLSGFFSVMTDESTDIGVLKQLVLVGRYVTNEGVKASFYRLQILQMGQPKLSKVP